MSARSWAVALLMVGGLALVASSCAGGDNDKAMITTSPATVELTGAGRELLNLLDQGLQTEYTVTYRTASPEGEQGDSFVVFNRAHQTRIDTIVAGSSAAGSLIIGGDSDTITIGCSGGSNQWSCVKIDPLGDSLLAAAGPIAFLSANDLALFDVSQSAERMVAGQQGRCFRLVPMNGEAGEAGEYCLSASGVPLYTETSSGTVEAIEFSSMASDQDFVPPAPIS